MAGQQDRNKVRESESVNRWLILLGLLYFIMIYAINNDTYRPTALRWVSLMFLISIIPLYTFHKGSFAKLIGFSIITYLLIMIAEIVSLKSLHFFGITKYGPTLGWQVGGVPIIKGVFMFGFIYCSCMLTETLKTRKFYKALLIAFFMCGIDVIIEKVATVKSMNFWTFGNLGSVMQVSIPLTQYLVWAAISFVLGYYFVFTFSKVKNIFYKYYLLFNLLFFIAFYFLWNI